MKSKTHRRELDASALENSELAELRKRVATLEKRERTREQVRGVLTRIASLAEEDPSPIVEIELNGADAADAYVTYRNRAARDLYPNLDALGINHPLLSNLHSLTMDVNAEIGDSITREIEVDDLTYTQRIIVTLDEQRINRVITVYSMDVTAERAAQSGLKAATREAELLAEENALLAEVGRIITSSLEIDDVYDGFARAVRRLIPFDRIAISLIDMDAQIFWNEYVFGVEAPGREKGLRIPLLGTMLGAAIEERDAVIFQGDLIALRRQYPMMVRSGLKSVIATPILFANDVLGVLHMRSLDADAYSEHHRDLIRKVSDQIAPAIANSQLYAQHTASEEEAKKLAGQNAVIAEIGRIISSSLEIEEVYSGFAEQTRSLVPFDRISINLIHAETEKFVIADVVGAHVDGRTVGNTAPLAGTFTNEVRSKRRAVVFHPKSVEHALATYPGLLPEMNTGLKSFLSVPLTYKGEVIGVLNFRSFVPDAYDATDLQVAELISAQIAGAIANSQMHAATIEADIALQQKAEELERSNAELEQFAYIASHDLQEPLRVIAGYVNLLEERYTSQLDREAHEFIAFAVDAVHRMRTLITDILSYSTVDSKGNPFELTDCNKALEEATADLEIAIAESGAKIHSDSLPTVMGDPVQISHLLENLISNAIKFRKDDEIPKIRVSCNRADDDWRFSVADNGIGIRPRYQDRIFGMFKRAHKRSKYAGTGIGLALCLKIVERHGGRIWVDSEANEGSTFYFTIPTTQEAVR